MKRKVIWAFFFFFFVFVFAFVFVFVFLFVFVFIFFFVFVFFFVFLFVFVSVLSRGSGSMTSIPIYVSSLVGIIFVFIPRRCFINRCASYLEKLWKTMGMKFIFFHLRLQVLHAAPLY